MTNMISHINDIKKRLVRMCTALRFNIFRVAFNDEGEVVDMFDRVRLRALAAGVLRNVCNERLIG